MPYLDMEGNPEVAKRVQGENQASDGQFYARQAYEAVVRQSNERLVRAAGACTAWEDGQHCWTEYRERPTDRTSAKSCVCGAMLHRKP